MKLFLLRSFPLINVVLYNHSFQTNPNSVTNLFKLYQPTFAPAFVFLIHLQTRELDAVHSHHLSLVQTIVENEEKQEKQNKQETKDNGQQQQRKVVVEAKPLKQRRSSTQRWNLLSNVVDAEFNFKRKTPTRKAPAKPPTLTNIPPPPTHKRETTPMKLLNSVQEVRVPPPPVLPGPPPALPTVSKPSASSWDAPSNYAAPPPPTCSGLVVPPPPQLPLAPPRNNNKNNNNKKINTRQMHARDVSHFNVDSLVAAHATTGGERTTSRSHHGRRETMDLLFGGNVQQQVHF